MKEAKDMPIQDRAFSRKVEIEGRVFTIEILKMNGGCFASVSENPAARMGAITLSIRSAQRVDSSSLVPDRKGGIFAQTLAQFLAEKSEGIAVVSFHLREEVDSAVMKRLVKEFDQLFLIEKNPE